MYQKEREIAIKAVTRAADLCIHVREDMVTTDAIAKRDKSPVTVADFGAQAIICEILSRHFPDDTIVGEEDSSALQNPANAATLVKIVDYVQEFYPTATEDDICEWIDVGDANVTERYWTVDPIDGTKGFLRNDQYAVALALVENGKVKVGALACPALPLDMDNPESPLGSVFIAVKGEGATVAPLHSNTFEPIRVSDRKALSDIRFVESVEAKHGNQPLQKAVAEAVGIIQPSLRMDSQAKYGAVARGDAALYLRLPSADTPKYCENIWDHAAGCLIVQEAGGKVTDMHGENLDFATDYRMCSRKGVIVSNGVLHQQVLDAIKEGISIVE